MKRPILIALIGYIMGVLLGLYLKISIALIFMLLFIVYVYLKNFVFSNKLRKYIKILLQKNVIIYVIFIAIISNTVILYKDYQYNFKYLNIKECTVVATVVSNKIEKEYSVQYKIKIESINNSKKYKNDYLLLYLKDKENTSIKFGDKIVFKGEFINPEGERNYRGFNYKNYLKSNEIYGSVKTNKIKLIKENNINVIVQIINGIAEKIIEKVNDLIKDDDNKNLLLGILLGKDESLDDSVKTSFKNSSLAHILAVSGLHVSYLVIGIELVLSRLRISKRISKTLTILFLIFFIYVTGAMPSVKRACIMSCLTLGASILYRKSDVINNISISMLLIFIQNPFSICNISVILSFLATIGIVVFYKTLLELVFKRNLVKREGLFYEFINRIKEIVCVSLAANICILPIMMIYFNNISLTFLISNLLISLIIGPIILIGFISIIIPLNFVSSVSLNALLSILIKISDIFSSIEISKLTVITPNIILVIFYYVIAFTLNYIYILKNKYPKRKIEKDILTIVDKFKYTILKLITIILIITILFESIYINISKEVKIYFIDVGQGDSTLIITPYGKCILIDGGGSKDNSKFDIGESILVPYLLDRGIMKLDYIMISHFDADHCNGLINVLERIKVNNVIISNQSEVSEEYKNIMKIIKEKNINVYIIKKGDKINLDKDIYIDILYPKTNLNFDDLNNNSIVAKFVYKSFSMLLTGDIEKEAEELILQESKEKLESTIIKIAHHGSKTSSSKEFIEAVNSKVALIGVGKNNKFGHPSDSVLQTLNNFEIKVYRTDLVGEIEIKVNNNGKIKIQAKIKIK